MKKTILITLNKIIFHIEEDAYEVLKKYLDSIKEHFSINGDAEEILAYQGENCQTAQLVMMKNKTEARMLEAAMVSVLLYLLIK